MSASGCMARARMWRGSANHGVPSSWNIEASTWPEGRRLQGTDFSVPLTGKQK
jgi:hypothetical protein